MIQTLKSRKRVNFEDCDPFSHLNNANYLNYFLNAREEQLRTSDILNIFDHAEKTGRGWAIMGHNIRYLKPARLGEELEIWSRMLATDSFTNLVEFIMINCEKRLLKSIMHTQFAYIDIKSGRPTAPDDEIKNLFNRLSLSPDKKIQDFHIDQRIITIKDELINLD